MCCRRQCDAQIVAGPIVRYDLAAGHGNASGRAMPPISRGVLPQNRVAVVRAVLAPIGFEDVRDFVNAAYV